MSTTSKRQGFTFTDDEVHAMNQMFTALYRGGDIKVLFRSKSIQGMAQKFGDRSRRLRADPTSTASGVIGK